MSKGGAHLAWAPISGASAPPMSWLRTKFTAPPNVLVPKAGEEVTATLNLDVGDVQGVSRGRFYVNGMDLGRYWGKLGKGSSSPSQRYYPIPFDILKPGDNANWLVLLDEMGAPNLGSVGFAVSTSGM